MLKVARFQKHTADELHGTHPLGLTRYAERARMHRVSVLQELGANDPIRSHQVSFRIDLSARVPKRIRNCSGPRYAQALCSSHELRRVLHEKLHEP
jgi:hypothetical protein